MPPTQLRGSQILDGTITTEDIDDALEKEFTKVRVGPNDLTPDFLAAKLVAGSNITITVIGASGSAQTLSIASTSGGGGGGDGSSLSVSGSAYSGTPSTLLFDSSTGFVVEDAGGGIAAVSIASHYKNIYVDGQPALIATGSDSLEIKAAGGITILTSVSDTDADGVSKELTISATALSSSFASSISTLESGMFTPAASSLPYYDGTAVAATLSPPATNRDGYVLGWVNNQLAWVTMAAAAVSFTSATYAEIAIDGKEISYTETIYVESGIIS